MPAHRVPGGRQSGLSPAQWFCTWNEMDWLSSSPSIVTVYVPACMPVVSMLTETAPLPSGPETTGATTAERCPVPVTDTEIVSQVWPGTVDVGSANGGPVTPNWPGSPGNTPKPSSTVVPLGVRPGM